MKLNFPTYLTLFRIVLIPLFVIAFYLPAGWYAAEISTLIFLLRPLPMLSTVIWQENGIKPLN